MRQHIDNILTKNGFDMSCLFFPSPKWICWNPLEVPKQCTELRACKRTSLPSPCDRYWGLLVPFCSLGPIKSYKFYLTIITGSVSHLTTVFISYWVQYFNQPTLIQKLLQVSTQRPSKPLCRIWCLMFMASIDPWLGWDPLFVTAVPGWPIMDVRPLDGTKDSVFPCISCLKYPYGIWFFIGNLISIHKAEICRLLWRCIVCWKITCDSIL